MPRKHHSRTLHLSTHEDYAQQPNQGALQDGAVEANEMSAKIINQLKVLEDEVAKHDDELDALNAKLTILDSTVTPKYIVSEKYHTWYIVQRWRDLPKADWKAHCGWRYIWHERLRN